ncbi:MAG TPA: hypothetical protein DGZ24_04420 [Rhodospirillaceae bacterium]|nr:hypothetical protein [Rhodospirillaceae bacterium]
MYCIRSFFARPRLIAIPGHLLLAAIISGCANTVPPPCPPVRVDSITATMTKFRDEVSQDLSDVEYQGKIIGFKGECVFYEEEVEVLLDIDFQIISGPAAQAGPVSLYYFAAIPQFFPTLSGKKVFEIQRRLTGGATSPQSFTESNVSVKIPLKEKQPAASFDVYLGFQLSDEQLQFNRLRMAR